MMKGITPFPFNLAEDNLSILTCLTTGLNSRLSMFAAYMINLMTGLKRVGKNPFRTIAAKCCPGGLGADTSIAAKD